MLYLNGATVQALFSAHTKRSYPLEKFSNFCLSRLKPVSSKPDLAAMELLARRLI
jgi:hypothetical protein